jgi:TfoX/Sxy family transcriptional regulator of competence genes
MVESYRAVLRSLLERVTIDDLGLRTALECKHFFSGAAAYANGRIFMTLTTVGLALKLPEESRAALIERGAKPLRYFPRGPIKKDYVVIPRRLAEDEDALAPWIKASIRFSLGVEGRPNGPRRRR